MRTEEIKDLITNLNLTNPNKIENSFIIQFDDTVVNDDIIKNFIDIARDGFYYKSYLINAEFNLMSGNLLYTNTIYRQDLVQKLIKHAMNIIELNNNIKIDYLLSIPI